MKLVEFLKAVFGRWISGLSGGIGLFLTFFTTFDPLKLGDVARAATLAASAFALIVAAYGAWAAERRRSIVLEAQVAQQGRLDIIFQPDVRQFEEELGGFYETVSRTVSVAVVNSGGSSVSGCKLWAVSVEPNEGNLAPDLQMHSMPSITLNPGDPTYVKIATFIEPKPGFPGDTMGLLHIPFRAEGKSSIANERTFSADTTYVLTFRATGNGSAPCTRKFRLWVGGGRLRMERLVS